MIYKIYSGKNIFLRFNKMIANTNKMTENSKHNTVEKDILNTK